MHHKVNMLYRRGRTRRRRTRRRKPFISKAKIAAVLGLTGATLAFAYYWMNSDVAGADADSPVFGPLYEAAAEPAEPAEPVLVPTSYHLSPRHEVRKDGHPVIRPKSVDGVVTDTVTAGFAITMANGKYAAQAQEVDAADDNCFAYTQLTSSYKLLPFPRKSAGTCGSMFFVCTKDIAIDECPQVLKVQLLDDPSVFRHLEQFHTTIAKLKLFENEVSILKRLAGKKIAPELFAHWTGSCSGQGPRRGYMLMANLKQTAAEALEGAAPWIATKLYVRARIVLSKFHELGFTHGDLKLDNIMVCIDDAVNLIDFGFSIDWSGLEQYVFHLPQNIPMVTLDNILYSTFLRLRLYDNLQMRQIFNRPLESPPYNPNTLRNTSSTLHDMTSSSDNVDALVAADLDQWKSELYACENLESEVVI